MPLVSTEPASGEVWVVDFGLAAKQRPVQGFASIDRSALQRKLGKLSPEQFFEVKSAIKELLDL